MKLKSYAATTHQGPFLEINEDCYDFDLDNQLFLIIDAFGGSGIGDKAALKLKEDIKGFIFNLSEDPDATMPLYWSARWSLEGNAIINAMIHSHQNLFKENSNLALNKRAGASMACAVKAGDVLVLSNVGNTSIFMLRNGNCSSLFHPDTHQYYSADPNGPSALRYPVGAFGFFPELSWQVKEVRLREGDVFVFASEGIAPWLTENEISHIVSRVDDDNQHKLNDLLKLSNERGNPHNQTAMILEF
jgi:PPM family protein phosphatase